MHKIFSMTRVESWSNVYTLETPRPIPWNLIFITLVNVYVDLLVFTRFAGTS